MIRTAYPRISGAGGRSGSRLFSVMPRMVLKAAYARSLGLNQRSRSERTTPMRLAGPFPSEMGTRENRAVGLARVSSMTRDQPTRYSVKIFKIFSGSICPAPLVQCMPTADSPQHLYSAAIQIVSRPHPQGVNSHGGNPT